MPDVITLMSSFALMEPISGIGVAGSIAYLNLQRFRYAAEIRNNASELYERLIQNPKFYLLNNTDISNTLRNLAEMRNHDRSTSATPPNGNNVPKDLKKVRESYNRFFRKQTDRTIVWIAGTISFGFMVLGVIDNIQSQFTNAFMLTSPLLIWLLLSCLIFCTVAPLLFILGGHRITSELVDRANRAYREAEQIYQNSIVDSATVL